MEWGRRGEGRRGVPDPLRTLLLLDSGLLRTDQFFIFILFFFVFVFFVMFPLPFLSPLRRASLVKPTLMLQDARVFDDAHSSTTIFNAMNNTCGELKKLL